MRSASHWGISPCACGQNSQCHRPFFGYGIGPVAMEHAQIELLLGREMPHAGHKRLPERTVIRPPGKDFVDGRVVNDWFPRGVCWHRQVLPTASRYRAPRGSG